MPLLPMPDRGLGGLGNRGLGGLGNRGLGGLVIRGGTENIIFFSFCVLSINSTDFKSNSAVRA